MFFFFRRRTVKAMCGFDLSHKSFPLCCLSPILTFPHHPLYFFWLGRIHRLNTRSFFSPVSRDLASVSPRLSHGKTDASSMCTKWVKFIEVWYHRPDEGPGLPELKERVVIFLPDCWNNPGLHFDVHCQVRFLCHLL